MKASGRDWLKQRRRELDLTQQALAQRVGCATVTIKKIEAGSYRPSKQVAARLAAELAIPPTDYAAFMQHMRRLPTDAPAAATLPSAGPALGTALPALPSALTPLVGRDDAVAAAVMYLLQERVHLLTLTGPGGVGKTRLGLAIANAVQPEFPAGVVFVPLATVREPDGVLAAIAAALGLPDEGPEPVGVRLVYILHDAPLLLLLDNFEQVAAAAPALAALLGACPRLQALVTSRAPLHLTGEHQLPVPPLPVPDRALCRTELAIAPAVALFVARARAVQADFALTDSNAATIAAICARLDGLPLAIELAAARSKLLSPAALLAGLQCCLSLLSGGACDLPPRQQTMREAIAWSVQLLPPDEARLFTRLGVFAGGWTLDSAVRVVGNPTAALGTMFDRLTALVDSSLVRVQPSADGTPRFGMLETIREYARELLQADGAWAEVAAAHARAFLDLAAQTALELAGPGQHAWLAYLETEHDNLRAALGWELGGGVAERALRLSAALWPFWRTRGHLSEGRRWLEAALAAAPASDSAARAQALNGAGWIAGTQGDFGAAETHLNASLRLYRELNDKTGIAGVLTDLEWVASYQGDGTRAAALGTESLALWRELGDSHGIARALNRLAFEAEQHGSTAQAADYYAESLALSRRSGNTRSIAYTLNGIGEGARSRGEYGRALACYRESQQLFTTLGDSWGIALALHNQAQIAHAQGASARAARLFADSLNRFHTLANQLGIAWCLAGLGGVAATVGQAALATHLLSAAGALLDTLGAELESVDRRVYRQSVATACAALPPADFAAAWTRGRELSRAEALALVVPLNDL